MTSRNLISHVYKTGKFVIAILRGKQGLLCDNTVFDRIENVVGKGENACHQHFLRFHSADGYQLSLLFPQCFQKTSSFRVVKNSGILG